MKQFLQNKMFLSVGVVIVLGLTGCGGGSSDSGITPVTTGTGYYVDSAVSGVSYTCGSKTGTTDADGKFTFEVGQGCTFSLAGVQLRTTPADELIDEGKILEDDEAVARFLQSIDSDGDVSNGITINPDILTVLEQALNDYSAGALPEGDTELQNVVGYVEQELPDDFNGTVKTEEEVQVHLDETKESVVTELLAGKTFYHVVEGDENDSVLTVTFNEDMTIIEDDGNDSIALDGEKLVWQDDMSYSVIVGQTSEYILVNDYFADDTKEAVSRLYFTQAAAQAYIASLQLSGFTVEMVSGKTVYEVYEYDLGWAITSLHFNANGTGTYAGISGENEGLSLDANWEIVNGDMITSGTYEGESFVNKHIITAENETYITTDCYDSSDGTAYEECGTDYYFYNLADAQNFTQQ